MFTGIVEEMGTVRGLRMSPGGMTIRMGVEVCDDLKLGDSLAVQGVCLTVVEVSSGEVAADVSLETLSRSNLGKLVPGDRVNLERALRLDGRLGGHIVLGHVDGMGTWERLKEEGEGWRAFVRAPDEVMRYVVAKGSVAVDGVSLTVASARGSLLSVALIPHTMQNTTLRYRKPGDRVNLEADVIGKYVYRYLHPGEAEAESGAEGLLEKLREGGFA
jgi:riboflavin synthase